jgi:hypothetical protein
MKKVMASLLNLLFRKTSITSNKGSHCPEWRFTVKKVNVNTLNIHITALISSPWCIYTKLLNIPDSSLFSIDYNQNAFVIFKDNLQEIGTPIEQFDEAVKEYVRSYRLAVNFVQTVIIIVEEPVMLNGIIKYVIGDGINKLETHTKEFKITLNE